MEDMQEVDVQTMDAETGSTQAEAAPSNPDIPDNDPKGVAFGKALAAEREKIRREIEAENAEKYKDYDVHKELSQYFSEINGGVDLLTLKERVEMERLQDRAEQMGITPEMQKRLEALEAKAAKADELERSQKEAEELSKFESTLKQFCEGKEIDGNAVDHNELWQYMHDNGTSNPEIAFKAMRHDALEKKLADAEKEGVKKFLQSKGSIPTVPGKAGTGQTVAPAAKTFAEARERALARFNN